jgi:hypothetical protein
MKLKTLCAIILLGAISRLDGWGRQYHGRCRQFVGNYGRWLWCMHGFCNLPEGSNAFVTNARCCFNFDSPCCHQRCDITHPLPQTLDGARRVFRIAERSDNPTQQLHELQQQGNFHSHGFHALWRYFVRDCGNKQLVSQASWDKSSRQGLPGILQRLDANTLQRLIGNAWSCNNIQRRW